MRIALVLMLLVLVPAMVLLWSAHRRVTSMSLAAARRTAVPRRGGRMKRSVGLITVLAAMATGGLPVWADEEVVAFAVVSEPPKDKSRIPAKVAIDGVVADMRLLANEQILANPIWKKLEICHAMKLEGQKTADGFRVSSVRVIDGAMLPMVLQGFAGDCLLKKALDVAPLVD